MEQRNLLIAIVVSVGILIGFQFLLERIHPTPVPHPTAATSPATTGTGESSTKPSPSGATSVPTSPGANGQTAGAGAPTTAPAAKPETREEAIAGQPRVKIDTPRLHGSIALRGARFDDLTLATYHETVKPNSPEVVLLEPPGTVDPYLAEFGWVAASGDAAGLKLPGADTLWKTTDTALTPSQPVTLTWDNGQGLEFTRVISVDQNYMFTIKDSVRNTGTTPVSLLPYGLISRTGIPKVSSGYSYRAYQGMLGEFGGSLKKINYADVKAGKSVDYTSPAAWFGFSDEYWLTALIPAEKATVKATFTRSPDAAAERFQSDFVGPAAIVAPHGTATSSTRFYAGAKEVNLLDAYATTGIPSFDHAVDFGWLFFLSKPIFQVLEVFNGLLGNFGLAIMLFTLLVKLAFFPLANKSYTAMSKMKLLQPEVKKLRERFPDDKMRQQQEMAALYKRVGANPMAGCLPIVVQIPVFWALYEVLYVTIEMRHAPFFGWIHDLSAPDPTSFANLFGLLHFAPPPFLMIGAWPLIMGVTMFLQQKLNPQPVDPMQARMFMLLPIVFTYMLAAFPAGLVIYWAWNNTLSIAQQWVIMRRQGAA